MKKFSCLVCLATTLLGCNAPTQQSAEQTIVKPQENVESNIGSVKSNVASETPESKPEEAPVTTAKAVVYGDQYPEVKAVKVVALKNNRWRFNVTLSSPYDSSQRYADAWRALDAQDKELGIRILGHDHASEQPFTRSHVIEIPENTSAVFVEGRDQANGWSGQRFKVELP